jgi:hypothetical protein
MSPEEPVDGRVQAMNVSGVIAPIPSLRRALKDASIRDVRAFSFSIPNMRKKAHMQSARTYLRIY